MDQILREHQGEIDVERTRGKGTSYRLRLPRHWEEKGFAPGRRPTRASR